MLSPVLMGALVGAAGGGAGALLGGLIDRLRRPIHDRDRKRPRSFASILGVVGGLAAIKAAPVLLPDLYHPPLEKQLVAASPEFQVLHDYYPSEFQQIVDRIKSAPDTSAASMQAWAVPMVGRIVSQHEKQIDDDNAVNLFSLVVDEAKALRQNNPKSCVAMMNGGVPGIDLTRVLTPSMRERDAAVTAAVLKQVATQPAPPPVPLTSDESVRLALKAYKDLDSGEQIIIKPLLSNLKQEMSDPQARAVCGFTINMFQEALEAPASTIRRLAATS